MKNVSKSVKNSGEDIYLRSEICSHCNQDIKFTNTCICKPIFYGDKKYLPVKFGDEKGYKSERCVCCNVKKDCYHHAGCEIEECPKCGEPLSICKC